MGTVRRVHGYGTWGTWVRHIGYGTGTVHGVHGYGTLGTCVRYIGYMGMSGTIYMLLAA